LATLILYYTHLDLNLELVHCIQNGTIRHLQVESVSSKSLVISMTNIANVTKVDMNAKLFDLNLINKKYYFQILQLFSFDQLIPNTWFALRLIYLPFYYNHPAKEPLKQVCHFQITLVIVPELICDNTVMKPYSKKATPYAQFHFNFSLIRINNKQFSCKMFCFYPYVKIDISNDMESFRSQKWCGALWNIPSSSGKLLGSITKLNCIFFYAVIASLMIYHCY
uniref:Phosphatidylinositol-glycan biosynthesis class X protein n=1 Tax=Syphacia muris TaxID=451379 RepID=A0A0N5ARB3_9BILA